MGLARFLRLSQPRHATQLTGSAALLARMRKSRAVTGEPDVAAAPAAAASAREEPSALSAPAGGFDGTFHLLYGGEAATQVAADLAAEARGCGLTPVLLAADEFRKAKLDRRAPYSTLLSARALTRAASDACSARGVAVFVIETVENAQPAEAGGACVRYFNRKRKEGAAGTLAGLLTYSVLGLGDTNLLLDRQSTTAADCNQASASLDSALRFLGATPLHERGEANDAVGLAEGVRPWAQALWPKMLALKKTASAAAAASHQQPQPPLTPSADLLVLYGSQTGNSAEIARNIGAAAASHGVSARVASMDEVSPEVALQPGAVILFVVSSTGDGDPPDNCASFYAKLRKLRSAPAARGVSYCVLGLGDQNYTKFMAVPRYFSARMEALGGRAFRPRGEADETEGLFEYVDAWTEGLWEPLAHAIKEAPSMRAQAATEDAPAPAAPPADATASSLASAPSPLPAAPDASDLVGVPPLPPCRVRLAWLPDEEARGQQAPSDGAPLLGDGSSPGSPFHAPLLRGDCRLLSAGWSDRTVVHAAFDMRTAGPELRGFAPGDSLALIPANPLPHVDALLARLGLAERQARCLRLEPAGLLPHVRCPVTARGALTHSVELLAAPRRALLRLLAEHCGDAVERHTLLLWSSRGGRAAYEAEVVAPKATLLSLLLRFPSSTPPLEALLDTLPTLAPRPYSVACAPEHCPDTPCVAFSLVRHAADRVGVATGLLHALALGTPTVAGADEAPRVPLFIRKGGAFTPPANPLTPLIMVGPGTGVAPFRGFLQRRSAQMRAGGSAPFGPAWLFFGCRRPDEDYLYREDLEAWAKDGTLSKLVTAFSRPEAPAQKAYVQQRIEEHGAEVVRLILDAQAPAAVYVCGDGAGMAKGVHAALLSVLEVHGGLSAEQAASTLAQAASAGHYVRDIWSS